MHYADNKKARFDYDILETYTAGIELHGFEVKAVRAHKAQLIGAHVTVRGNEALLLNASIPPYQTENTPPEYDPKRNRRLLLTKKEIEELANKEAQKGLTIVPLSLYNKGTKIKLDIAVVRGKKKYDKRESIKERETDIDIRRTLKNE